MPSKGLPSRTILGKAKITDCPKPVGSDPNLALVREITIEQNGENLEGLVFRAGTGAVEREEGLFWPSKSFAKSKGPKPLWFKIRKSPGRRGFENSSRQ